MKNFTHLSILAVSFAFCFTFQGCKKGADETDKDTEAVADNNTAETHFDAIFKEVDNASRSNGVQKAGPSISIDSVSSPKTMTIDYGSTNMMCNDGKLRRGKLNVTWTGKYRDPGTVITITFDNFYQKDQKIEGTKTIVNNGRNAQGHLSWTITVTGSKIITATNETIKWSSTRTRTWTAGEDSMDVRNANWNNDEYEITGSAIGVNRKGSGYTLTITKPLQIKMGCQYRIVRGTIELQPDDKEKSKRTIDYGEGGCDATITIAIKTKSYTITKN